EFEVHRHLKQLGYPVPHAVLIEEDSALFGGPFLILEQIVGRTLVQYLARHVLRLWPGAYQMAKTHIRLHQLPTEGFPTRREPFLTRRLGEIEALINKHRLAGLNPGLEWLRQHRPEEPERDSILHLDFHPLNLMRTPDRSMVVLDWPESDVGDFHADLG